MKKCLPAISIILFLVTLPILVPGAFAESTSPKPAGDPAVALNATQSSMLRAMVATALSQVAQTRKALRDKDNARVADGLSTLNMQLELIGALRPGGELLSLVAYLQTDMDLEDNQQVLSKFLPLYRALEILPASPGVAAAKKGLDSAKQALEQPDRGKAIRSLDAVADILNVDRIDLPLKAAEDSLGSAISSMVKNDLPKDEVLLSLEKNLFLLLDGIISMK